MNRPPPVILPAHIHTDELPRWVDSLGEGGWENVPIAADPRFHLSLRAISGFSLASLRIPARELPHEAFEGVVADAYRVIAAALKPTRLPHPVRIWNVIPDIHRPVGDGTDRYMTFNAGRFKAFAEWFGGADSFSRLVPAASGVGHEGDDFVLHVLAAAAPGAAVSNPRQTAPYRYSRRYGPLPPCFARATLIPQREGKPLLLVGGTASIRGEASVHERSLGQQTAETIENLACLAAASAGEEHCDPADSPTWLRRYRELRVYLPRIEDRQPVATMLGEAFGPETKIEFVRADLCRSELLVEIEGIADGSPHA